MFKLYRDQCLAKASWYGTDACRFEYVEAWKYANLDHCTDENFRHGYLHDDQTDDWLARKGEFAPLQLPNGAGALQGTIRLVLCHRPSFRPPGFAMSKASFQLIEKAFNLPVATLQAAFQDEGVCSRRFVYSPGFRGANRVEILIKAAQKVDIANYLLSLSHEVSTGSTTAFILGNWGRAPQNPIIHPEHPGGPDTSLMSTSAAQSSQIRALIQATSSLWAHPMLLPITLLQNHSFRAQAFSYSLGTRVLDLEYDIGVAFPVVPISQEDAIKQQSKRNLLEMTTRMHSTMVQVLFVTRVYHWAVGCAAFLLKTHDEIANILPLEIPVDNSVSMQQASRELRDAAEHMSSSISNMGDFVRTLKDRVQSQLEVVYSFIAQYDAKISTKIAISAGRDSTAMKTLAFITAFFLPGSYVAALFSMTMFSWQAPTAPSSTSSSTSSSSRPSVSSYFWIYWVVTVPLTLMVMYVWRKWWQREDRVYKRELESADKIEAVREKVPPRSDRFYWMGWRMA